ncbi:hypothetical protein Pcinc_005703 [Petrolisthes cinctipes]|uniref:Uncharacterized protein n=1 Tax=Petrolisthes cinctipes TaxID=88211 RepID=A0AAE1GEA1_PETCI|nr:hypothetical protein Pcinc_005703 [Petrolisthes cinctipes]
MEEQPKLKQEDSKMKDELKTLGDKNAAICQRLENIECKVNSHRPTPNVSRETNQNEGEKDEINELREELRMLKVANYEVRDMIKGLDKKWIERENELVRKVTEKVMENIEDMRDQEKRKNNVVIFNVLESKKEELKEREEDDRKLYEQTPSTSGYSAVPEPVVNPSQKKKKQRGKASSSSSEVPLVSSSPSEEDKDNVYKAGKRSPEFMSFEDDASPVSDGNASIPEVSTVLAKYEEPVLEEDPLSFSVGDFVVVRFGGVGTRNPHYYVCKIIQFNEHKKLFTGYYMRKTQLHKSVQGFMAFKYPKNLDQYETSCDDIVLKLGKPVINKGIHSFKNCCFSKFLMR